MQMVVDQKTKKERYFWFFMVEIDSVEAVVDGFEYFRENLYSICTIRLYIDDVISAHSFYAISKGIIFCVT